RLLRPRTLDRLPLEEAVDRQQAAPIGVSTPEHRCRRHPLGCGVDGFELRGDVLDPTGDEPPGQAIKRARACLGVLTYDPVLLPRRTVVARRRLEQRFHQGCDLETENLGIALLGDATAHEPVVASA